MFLSVQIGLAFLHLAVDSKSPQVRRAVIKAIEGVMLKQSQLVNRIIRESLSEALMRDKPSTPNASGSPGEDHEVSTHRQVRLSAFLSSAAAINEDIDLSVREGLMTELVVLGHHPAICRLIFMSLRNRVLDIFLANCQLEAHGKHGSSCVRKPEPIHITSLTRMSTDYSKSF